MMNWDPVMWLSILMVIIAIIIIIFLAFKVKALMDKDAAAHRKG
jgi:prolipoprotein diacylglyceryltransferase